MCSYAHMLICSYAHMLICSYAHKLISSYAHTCSICSYAHVLIIFHPACPPVSTRVSSYVSSDRQCIITLVAFDRSLLIVRYRQQCDRLYADVSFTCRLTWPAFKLLLGSYRFSQQDPVFLNILETPQQPSLFFTHVTPRSH